MAPVSKTVTYGTVTSIPGESSKCWITSNLGSDHQAAAVSDATEASAGWYWQFNHKQGYKNTGTIRIPNTVWITYVNENADWQAGNDPCSIELGNGWRIPANTEWSNVIAAGGWTNWNGPWGSRLKMHASGYLFGGNGFLVYRGIRGYYWSGKQSDGTIGWGLNFWNTNILIHDDQKNYAFSLRCLRD